MTSAILNEVSEYYSAKLAAHGQTAQGVDWNGEESQELRFRELCRIIDQPQFCITDMGCGYGAMVDYIAQHFPQYQYTGTDISSAMVEAAQQRYAGNARARFIESADIPIATDYVVASGIFNVRQQRSDAEWLDYVLHTLDSMFANSHRGFAANFLTSYSDSDKKRDYLYYADPLALFDHCKKHYSRHVSLLHDYGLYEFTLVVRKVL